MTRANLIVSFKLILMIRFIFIYYNCQLVFVYYWIKTWNIFYLAFITLLIPDIIISTKIVTFDCKLSTPLRDSSGILPLPKFLHFDVPYPEGSPNWSPSERNRFIYFFHSEPARMTYRYDIELIRHESRMFGRT